MFCSNNLNQLMGCNQLIIIRNPNDISDLNNLIPQTTQTSDNLCLQNTFLSFRCFLKGTMSTLIEGEVFVQCMHFCSLPEQEHSIFSWAFTFLHGVGSFLIGGKRDE